MTTATLNIPIDAAVARLRQAGRVVERQGILWRVSAPGAEATIQSADEVRALALTLGESAKPIEPPPAQWGPQSLPIAVIRRDGGTQARVGLNEDVVQEYAEAMRDQRWDWATLKRPLVYHDGESGDYWLADGFHRIEAAQRANLTDYRVEVLRGDKRAAQLHAARANADHGLRRSRQDVQRAIELLLRDAEWAKWSDREIARHVHCAHATVGATRRQLESAGQIVHLSERQGADGKSYSTAGIAAANQARAALPQETANTPPYSVAQAFPLALRKRAELLGASVGSSFDITHQRALVSLPGDTPRWMGLAELTAWCDAREQTTTSAEVSAIPPDIAAAAQNLALTIEVRGDRLLLYWPDEADQLDQMDPLTPDLAREWLQTEAPGAAQNRAEALGWDQRVSSDGTRAWYRLTADGRETAAYAVAALAAGDALRIAYGETAPAAIPPGLSPEAVAHRAVVTASNDLESRGWTVRRIAGDDVFRLTIGADQYETSGAGVVTASLLLAARDYATPDDLMAAVNAIGDEAPAAATDAPFWQSMSEHHPTAHHWTRTGQYSYRAACGMTTQRPPSGSTDAGQCSSCARVLASAEAMPTTTRACECGKPAIAQRNIGGISGWRCQGCASDEEQEDLHEQLGDQYLGWDATGDGAGVHHIRWADGSGGDYSYEDALSMLHSSAMQLRRQAAAAKAQPLEAPIEPRAAAVAWLAKMRTMLATCSPHAMFRLSEMQTAVAHIDALLATPAADVHTTIRAITERVVEAETWLGHDLSAPHLPAVLRQCRKQLDGLADDPAISTEAYDMLSARLGDCQAQLVESESEVAG